MLSRFRRFRDILDNTFSVVSSNLGLGTEFRSKTVPRNRLKTVSVILRKKEYSYRGIPSEAHGRVNSEAQFAVEHTCPGAKNNAVEHTRPRVAQTAIEQTWRTCPGRRTNNNFRKFAFISVP